MATGITLIGGVSAHADDLESSIASLEASEDSAIQADPACESARIQTGESGACASEVITRTLKARPLTPQEIVEYGALQAADGTTVAAAARAGKVYIRGWQQEVRGLYYVNWKERHQGKFLFNGKVAWVDDRNGYTGGHHMCNLGYAIGYTLENVYCREYGQGTARIDNVDKFKVHVIFKGFPISFTHSMTAKTYGTGSVR